MKHMLTAGILAFYVLAYTPHGFAQTEPPFLGTWKPVCFLSSESIQAS